MFDPPSPLRDEGSVRELRQRNARRETTERRRVTQHLRHALADDGFVLQYQPLVCLSSGLIRGAESLLRLRHHRRGLVSASHFMPITEHSDVITGIGGWILQNTCRDAASWPDCVSVAASLSLRHLRSGQLVRQLLEAVGASGLAPHRLELQLTEAMLIDDNEDAIFSLRALHGIGVRLALNNFGLGYASLSAVKRLPLSTLRLDRSLIQSLGEMPDNTGIIRAAIEAGHALGCTVLADGVENEVQFQQLGRLGCDEGQGPYFGPAVSAGEISAMLGAPHE